MAKTHPLGFARQDLLQLRRGGGPILSSSAPSQFLALSRWHHQCLGGQLFPEPPMQKLRAMDLTVIAAFLQSCRCCEGAASLVPSMAHDRRDWRESFTDAQIPGETSRAAQPQPCVSQQCEFFLKVIFCPTICSHLKDSKPQGVYPVLCSDIWIPPPVSNLSFTSA